MMQRRDFIKGSLLLSAAALFNPELYRHRLLAFEEAIEITYDQAVEAFSAGKKSVDGSALITLDIPTRPGSAVTIPVEINVKSPMNDEDYISAIAILTTKNKVNKAVTVDLSPANGMAYLFANIKLGETQEVVVLAKTNKGVIYKASKKIHVALSGCE